MVCELTGICSRLDESVPLRQRINARLERRALETSVRDILRDVVRDVKTPPRVYTSEELEKMASDAFAFSNRHLGVYATKESVSALQTLAKRIFEVIHCSIGIAEDRNAAISASYENWKKSMSMEELEPLIDDIREGRPLHPPSRVATVVEPADGSEMWDGSVAISGAEDEEDENPASEENDDRRKSIVAQKERDFFVLASEMDEQMSNILADAQLRPLEESYNWSIARRILFELSDKVSDVCEAVALEVRKEEEEKAKEEAEESESVAASEGGGSDGEENDGDDEGGDRVETPDLDPWHQWRGDPVGKLSRERVWNVIGDFVDSFERTARKTKSAARTMRAKRTEQTLAKSYLSMIFADLYLMLILLLQNFQVSRARWCL